MAKRIATSELTDRNWDVEDEVEEAGIFSQANENVLKQRQIKKAKRRNPNESVSSAFSGFQGFGANVKTGAPPIANNLFTLKTYATNGATTFPQKDTPKRTSAAAGSDRNSTYYHSLQSLNKSFLSWVKKHVEGDPCCILTPIFDDYSQHLNEIKKNNNETKGEVEEEDADSDQEIIINMPQAKKPESPAKKVPEVKLAESKDNNGTSKPSGFGGFSFSSASSGFGTAATGFSFGLNKPSTNVTSAGAASGTTADDDEYVPPKVETQEVSEEGSVYTKRCKLFYQKAGEWKERGIGNIHLKVSDNDKTQIIIRADTNLGNILLNIMLTSAIPSKRQGKNNVWIVCVPNPQIDPKDDSGKPVPMLIRVKTEADADELLEKLEELKK